jgi:outer membrane protein OmpA-like peptidoglycan-associated protein
MRIVPKGPRVLIVAALGMTASAVVAQPQDPLATVVGANQVDASQIDISQATEGPELDGIISARNGNTMQVTTADGANTTVAIIDSTTIKSSGGFLGLDRDKLTATSLLNGLPVALETLQTGGGLVASRIKLKSKDLKTASMIRTGTAQRFGQHDVAIQQNAAATEALRGRMGDIDQYNIKQTTNVHFDTGKAVLSAEDKNALCTTASQAEAMDNALLLVVGYTDSTGDMDFNQQLSEKRAGRVVNYLQQACGWKPYRMLTPTGMSEADPLASNDSASGKAQNRRVAVNILVSKGLDGL